jgi:hypothetical protein
MNKQTDYFDE